MFYASIDELPSDERPSDKIINNDKLLDNWLQERETKRLHNQQGSKKGAYSSGNWGRASVVHGG